ncbi:MAG: NAD(P)-binding domain-containing protein [Thermodesulfovibrio sp.]|uniref:Oxidoreductase n=1 Tax=Thermodesulfovibrio aggregans TaxID=86166 RepID=A0A2J6WPA0_9BACT|nr:MAG: oxidoreductase [Thermodesulfovibrio aggregans]
MKTLVSIIGAGPAGLATAVELKAKGIEDLIIFEKGGDICSTIRKLYPPQKRVDKVFKGLQLQAQGICDFQTETKEAFLERMRKYVKDYEIKIKFNTRIDGLEKLNDFYAIKHENLIVAKSYIVILAIGVFDTPRKPSYPIPEEVKDKVFFRLPKEFPQNEKILIVGGGNSAVETACALSDSCEVFLSYRREKLFRVNEENLKELEKRQNKIRLILGSDIEKLEPANQQVKVVFKDGSEEIFSKIFYCLGGSAPKDFLQKIGIEFVNGKPKIDEFGESNLQRVFLVGDIATERGSIMFAFNSAYKVVKRIIEKYSIKEDCGGTHSTINSFS